MTRGPSTAGDPLPVPLQVLWPDAVRSAVAPRLGDYVAVPGLARARVLLPRDRRAAAAVLREFRAAGTLRERLRTTALLAGLPFLRDRVVVGGPAGTDSLERHLADLLDQPVVLGVQLGAPRANRKPCLQVLSADHRPLAFAKLGVGALSDRLIDNEGAALETLAGRDLPGVRVPEVRHHGRWHDHALLVTEALPLRRARRDDASAVRRAMVTVARSASGPGVGWLDRQRERAAALPDGRVREVVTAVHRMLEDRAGEWPTGAWHGDWTAWNAATLDGQVLVWDWERHAEHVPLGWDALHDALRRDIALSGPTPEVARELLNRSHELTRDFGVPITHATGVALAYLLEIALRYTEDDQAAAGGRSARVEEWLLPVLEGPWAG